MIAAILGVLFVSSALASVAILAASYRKAFDLHGQLRGALAAANSHREVRIRMHDMKVHAAVTQLPTVRNAGRNNGRNSLPDLPLAA